MAKPTLRVELRVIAPPVRVLVGVQSGHGSAGKSTMNQWTTGADLSIPLELEVRENGNNLKFTGPYVQSDSKGQFIYLRWGKAAGDWASGYSRRTKVYLHLLTPELIRSAISDNLGYCLGFAGKSKDGGPACATVAVDLL